MIKYRISVEHSLKRATIHNICNLFKVMTLAKSWQILFPPESRTGEQVTELATHLLTLPALREVGEGAVEGRERWMKGVVVMASNNIYANCLLCASFRINKSQALYIYTGNVQITPQGLGKVEFSTFSTFLTFSTFSTLVSPFSIHHCCGHRHLRRTQFLFPLFFIN